MSREQDSPLPEYKKYSRKELTDVVIDTVCNNVGHGLDAHDVSEDSDIIDNRPFLFYTCFCKTANCPLFLLLRKEKTK